MKPYASVCLRRLHPVIVVEPTGMKEARRWCWSLWFMSSGFVLPPIYIDHAYPGSRPLDLCQWGSPVSWIACKLSPGTAGSSMTYSHSSSYIHGTKIMALQGEPVSTCYDDCAGR